MSKNKYIIPIVCLIVIISLVIIVYNTHMLMKNAEEFTEYNTTKQRHTIRCLPKKNKDIKEFSKNKYHDFKVVKETNVLTLLGCITEEFSQELLSKLSDICYTTCQEFSSTSKNKIYEKILDDLRKTKGSDELLIDPVYTIIFEYDTLGEDNEKFNRMIMMYPHYPKVCDKQHKQLQNFLNHYLYSVKHQDCSATVYQLNKDHKMFYDLLQKKVYANL